MKDSQGRPLQRPPASRSGITTGLHYEEMNTAQKWGLTPTGWYDEARWSRAAMMALERVRKRVAYWDWEWTKPREE